MDLLIGPSGSIRCIYGEAVDLGYFGQLLIRRGSHVEPTVEGNWTADLSPVGGPVLGPFSTRTEALNAEITWLGDNWLTSPE